MNHLVLIIGLLFPFIFYFIINFGLTIGKPQGSEGLNSNLALSEGNVFGMVPAQVVVYTPLKLPGNEGSVLPATFRVGQALPLAQIIWIPSCRFLV